MHKLITSGEEVVVQFVEAVKPIKGTGQKSEAVWSDYSQRWFTLMHSTRPLILRDYEELADNVNPIQAFLSTPDMLQKFFKSIFLIMDLFCRW